MLQQIKISSEKPPQWILDAVKKQFDVNWEDNVIFTYGDLITSSRGEMREDLMAHEPYHTQQQSKFGGKDKWWKEYLKNPEFRYKQELEAYRKQYKWTQKNVRDRNESFQYLMHYARSLAGPMYGNISDVNQALKEIKQCN